MKIVAKSVEAYGEAVYDVTYENVRFYRSLLKACKLDGHRLESMLDATNDIMIRHAPEALREMRLVADGAGVYVDEIILLNMRSELLSMANWQGHECTSVAVSAAASEDGIARIGQNWDWIAKLRDLPVVWESREPRFGPRYVTFCEAGQLAKIGINEVGLAVGLNFLEIPKDEIELARQGLPIHVLIRIALAQPSVEMAVRVLKSLPRGGAANLVLADASGEACMVEIQPSRVDVISASITTHANDFEYKRKKSSRSERLLSLVRVPTNRQKVSDALCDHEGTEPICSHLSSPLASMTIASIVAECGPKPALYVTKGPPCKNSEVMKYKVLG